MHPTSGAPVCVLPLVHAHLSSYCSSFSATHSPFASPPGFRWDSMSKLYTHEESGALYRFDPVRRKYIQVRTAASSPARSLVVRGPLLFERCCPCGCLG